LDLVAVQHRIALTVKRIVVAPDADVVPTGDCMKVQPIDRRRNADGLVLILVEMKQNCLAMSTGNFAQLLTASLLISFSASGPLMFKSAM
jgi:hypothetical protein